MTVIKKTFKYFTSLLLAKATNAFDIRDVFVFGGIAMLGYGFYLLRPWLGFSVSGAILFCLGLFVGKRAK